jgi:hypothetical protein
MGMGVFIRGGYSASALLGFPIAPNNCYSSMGSKLIKLQEGCWYVWLTEIHTSFLYQLV